METAEEGLAAVQGVIGNWGGTWDRFGDEDVGIEDTFAYGMESMRYANDLSQGMWREIVKDRV